MKRRLLQLARSQIAGFILRWMVTHMAWAIPAKRLHETNTLLAFHHPAPSYPVHILIVPKRPYNNLLAVDEADVAFMQDVFLTAQHLVTKFALENSGYRLICNGGIYQDVNLLHFHLISEQP